MPLIAGDKLNHSESGQEVEYVTALPTVGHGFIHLLKSAEGYIFRLTGDLENEFSLPDHGATIAEEGASILSAGESAILSRIEAMLRNAGLNPDQAREVAGATGQAQATSGDSPQTQPSGPYGAREVQATPAVPNVLSHLPDDHPARGADTGEETDTPESPAVGAQEPTLAPSVAPTPAEPPRNAIPL